MLGFLASLGSALGSAAGSLASSAAGSGLISGLGKAITPLASTMGEGMEALNEATKGLGGLQGIGSMLGTFGVGSNNDKNNNVLYPAQKSTGSGPSATFINYMPPQRKDPIAPMSGREKEENLNGYIR